MENKKHFLINVAFFSTLFLLIYLSITALLRFSLPILASLIVGIAVQKPAQKLSKKMRIKNTTLAAFLGVAVYFLAAVLVFALVYLFISFSKNIIENFTQISESLVEIFNDFKTSVSGIFSKLSPDITNGAEEIFMETAGELANKVGGYITSSVAGLVSNMPALLFNTVISLVACSYIAKDYARLVKFFKNLFGQKIYENTIKIKEILTHSVLKIFKGYLKLALISFGILAVVFAILGFKYWLILAVFIAIVDLLPVLGTGTVLVPWAVIDLSFGNLSRGIIIAVLYVGITLLRNFLEPKIIAVQLGINPLFMLLSIFLGLKLFGFWGIIILPLSLVVVFEFYSSAKDN